MSGTELTFDIRGEVHFKHVFVLGLLDKVLSRTSVSNS